MKRIVAIFLLIAILVTGCSTKPQLGAYNIDVARDIINNVDRYLDGKMDVDSTRIAINAQAAQIDMEDKDISKTAPLEFSTSVTIISASLSRGGDRQEIIKERNKIAKLAGLDKYGKR